MYLIMLDEKDPNNAKTVVATIPFDTLEVREDRVTYSNSQESETVLIKVKPDLYVSKSIYREGSVLDLNDLNELKEKNTIEEYTVKPKVEENIEDALANAMKELQRLMKLSQAKK